ncbi:MAG: hypothetical protein ACRDS9_22690 [Pseudonocardiaceae bacterium]
MLADFDNTTRTSRALLASAALCAVTFAVTTPAIASFSAPDLEGLLLLLFVVAAAITFVGWATLTAFSYALAFKGRRRVALAALALAAAGAGGVISVLTLAASLMVGSTFAGPIIVVQVIWNFGLAAMGFLAMRGSR